MVKTVNETDEIIDPMLIAALEEDSAASEEEKPQNVTPSATDEVAAAFGGGASDKPAPTPSEPQAPTAPAYMPDPAPVREGDLVVIEDYTPSGQGMHNLRNAIARSDSRTVRIGMIGDSYIEGDVFSQNIRSNLQTSYGGRGVGYMGLHSEIPGFRQSVRQTDSGWTAHDIRKSNKNDCKWLAGEYFVGSSGAKSSFQGVSRIPHAEAWNSSKFLFIAPSDGVISIDTGAGPVDYPVKASPDVQCITVAGETEKITVKNGVPGLVALGLWLNDDSGVTLDCMSHRGNSGISHRTLNPELCRSMAEFIDYDLIIVEYGINALSSAQKNYSNYASLMEKVINTLKACYPNADILMMGIGDRGQKSGGAVHSLPTAQNMVDAQRDTARKTGILFWDTREAMGGEDAIVEWRNNKLVNADYIHLNHKGGEALARRFTDAINHHLSR